MGPSKSDDARLCVPLRRNADGHLTFCQSIVHPKTSLSGQLNVTLANLKLLITEVSKMMQSRMRFLCKRHLTEDWRTMSLALTYEECWLDHKIREYNDKILITEVHFKHSDGNCQLNSTQVYYNLVVGRPNSTINHNT